MFADSKRSLPELVGKDSNLAGAILERIQRGRGRESLETSRSQDQQADGRGPTLTKMAVLSSPVPLRQWCLSVSWGAK